jgi:hypothetical protein
LKTIAIAQIKETRLIRPQLRRSHPRHNQAIASGAVSTNKAGVAKEAIKDNLQSAADKGNEANKATAAKEAIKDNHQAIASGAVSTNKAGVAKEAIKDNLQSAADIRNEANKAELRKKPSKITTKRLLQVPLAPTKLVWPKKRLKTTICDAVAANKAGAPKEAIEDNLQPAGNTANEETLELQKKLSMTTTNLLLQLQLVRTKLA